MPRRMPSSIGSSRKAIEYRRQSRILSRRSVPNTQTVSPHSKMTAPTFHGSSANGAKSSAIGAGYTKLCWRLSTWRLAGGYGERPCRYSVARVAEDLEVVGVAVVERRQHEQQQERRQDVEHRRAARLPEREQQRVGAHPALPARLTKSTACASLASTAKRGLRAIRRSASPWR